ncbi:unnamed protein product [Closterium sp. NIES-65]|nr:unnamed protein product [Closterium sp. NIES-65]
MPRLKLPHWLVSCLVCLPGIILLCAAPVTMSSGFAFTDKDLAVFFPRIPRDSRPATAQLTSSQSQGIICMQISVRRPEFPTVFRVIIAGSVDPPTRVSLWDNRTLATGGDQWKLVAPGVWDLAHASYWPAGNPSSWPGPDTKTVTATHAGVNGGTLEASGALVLQMETGAYDTVTEQGLLPSMASGRFQAMFSGDVAGGAKIRIAASNDSKVTLEVHLVFTRGVTANTGVSIVGQVGADTSDPLPLACPFNTPLLDAIGIVIPGVFTCVKTIDVNIPAETASKPKVLGLQRFMAALVGATLPGDYLASTFTLTVNGQSENLYYSL